MKKELSISRYESCESPESDRETHKQNNLLEVFGVDVALIVRRDFSDQRSHDASEQYGKQAHLIRRWRVGHRLRCNANCWFAAVGCTNLGLHCDVTAAN